LSAFSRACG